VAKERLPFGGQSGDGGGLFRAPVPPAGQSLGLGRNALGQFTPERFSAGPEGNDAWLKATENIEKLGGASGKTEKAMFRLHDRAITGAVIFAALWKGVKLLEDWSKRSAGAMKLMSESSERFAIMIGKDVSIADRVSAAEAEVKARRARVDELSGSGGFAVSTKPGGNSWWGSGQTAFWNQLNSLFGTETPKMEFNRALIEKGGAEKKAQLLKNYQERMGSVGGSFSSFAGVGENIQKQILDGQMLDLTKQMLDGILQIERNTADQQQQVTP
jgi:hypothetical protein